MQSEHDAMKNVDGVSTLMMLMSLYHCNEKKLLINSKISMCSVCHCSDFAIGTNSHTV